MSEEKQSSAVPLERLIATQGFVLLTPQGNSMWPMIRYGLDSVKIVPKPHGRLSRYDIPVYRRDTGKVVFHRILKVKEDGYLICGDNQSRMEFVREDQILGVMEQYYRKDAVRSPKAFWYRFYLHTYCALPLWMRKWVLRVWHLPLRLRRKKKDC